MRKKFKPVNVEKQTSQRFMSACRKLGLLGYVEAGKALDAHVRALTEKTGEHAKGKTI